MLVLVYAPYETPHINLLTALYFTLLDSKTPCNTEVLFCFLVQ